VTVRRWTFGRRIAAAFAVMVALTVVVGVISVVALDRVVASKDRVINVNSRVLIDAQTLSADFEAKSSDARGYLLTGDKSYLAQMTSELQAFQSTLASMERNAGAANELPLLTSIGQESNAHQQALDGVIALRERGVAIATVAKAYTAQVNPVRAKLVADISALSASENRLLAKAQQSSTNSASAAVGIIVAIAIITALIATALGFALARALRRQIGKAVAEVNSSSVELQATANQQATSAREQSTAMNEISTTISELLATSRQIAESAQRVAQIAGQTANAGRSGEQTIAKAQAYITDVRRQVDVIVDHMLALGDKSQQIGGVLDIVTELAEQTNILAINSTIEAAGAGEAGKRFAVVADEIRKLADRVAGSTKEIRGLIDVVRSAVNTTVMATEIGSKAVDAGNEQFANVASAFGEIADLVDTTNEAAREIELSTKQQSTAVEQVNAAISDVAQSTNETEAGSRQTFETASQLTTLSRELGLLVEPQAVV
jgi:methyl-accepting chemotaxis protein